MTDKEEEKYEKEGWGIWVIWGMSVLMIFAVIYRSLRGFIGKLDMVAFGDRFDAVNALFSGLAFSGIVFTILLQRKELQLQRKELKDTRRVLKDQQKEMALQNATLKKEQFENTFFQLLNNNMHIVNSIIYTGYYDNKTQSSKGRSSFASFYHEFKESNEEPPDYTSDDYLSTSNQRKRGKQIVDFDSTIKNYNLFFRRKEDSLGNYFRNLYHVIKFVDNSNIEDKKTYTNFVRAQLSSYELALIFYNGLGEHGNYKFKPLIEKYALLKNMNHELIFNQEHLSKYESSAYG